MRILSARATMSFLYLDSWSETYVGARWLLQNVLPEKEYQVSAQHGLITKMIIISSSHMVELMLSFCLKEKILKLNIPNQDMDNRLECLDRMNLYSMLNDWDKILPELEIFDTSIEPFISVNKLRLRRNSTIHKESSLASLEMARSALYTATTASEVIFKYIFPEVEYKYSKVLNKYPIEQYHLFSDISYVEDGIYD